VKKQAASSGDGRGPSRVLIVDDHPIVREGLRTLIEREPDLCVCAEAGDAAEAMKALESTEPDVVVLDISLKESSGIELLRDLRLVRPDVAVLALSIHDESVYAERLLRAGAQGYVMKQEGTLKVVEGIRAVLGGEVYLSAKMSRRLLKKMVAGRDGGVETPIERLTNRELEVLRLIGRGYGTRQIGEVLHLSPKTIETYREHIKTKLKLDSARELLQYAVKWARSEGAE